MRRAFPEWFPAAKIFFLFIGRFLLYNKGDTGLCLATFLYLEEGLYAKDLFR